jgi:predicted RNA polymerase sigma factor
MRHRPGQYELEAAIVACHAEALSWAETDWEQFVVLCGMLLCRSLPSPGASAASLCRRVQSK